MAKEDTRRVQAEATRETGTATKDSSEHETPTAHPAAHSSQAKPDDPKPDLMAAWFEEQIANAQYSSPAWQALTSGLLYYQGLKASGSL